jgi:hypothetical protein
MHRFEFGQRQRQRGSQRRGQGAKHRCRSNSRLQTLYYECSYDIMSIYIRIFIFYQSSRRTTVPFPPLTHWAFLPGSATQPLVPCGVSHNRNFFLFNLEFRGEFAQTCGKTGLCCREMG